MPSVVKAVEQTLDTVLWQTGRKHKRAIASPLGAKLIEENGAKHLTPDNSAAKQLAPTTADWD